MFEDLEFRRCRFESCGISISRDPGRRATVRDIRIIDCEEEGSSLWGAIVENVLVDGFRTAGLFQCWAPVY